MGRNNFILIHISFSFEIHVLFCLCEVVITQTSFSLVSQLCLIFVNWFCNVRQSRGLSRSKTEHYCLLELWEGRINVATCNLCGNSHCSALWQHWFWFTCSWWDIIWSQVVPDERQTKSRKVIVYLIAVNSEEACVVQQIQEPGCFVSWPFLYPNIKMTFSEPKSLKCRIIGSTTFPWS